MKILVVVENIDEKTGGGATERARQLANNFVKNNEVSLLTTGANLSNISDPISNLNRKIKTLVLPCILKRFYVPYPRVFQLNNLIKESDFIHIVNHWTVLNILVFFLIKLNNKPYSISPLGSLTIYGRSKLKKVIYNYLIGRKIINSANLCIVATENEVPELLKLNTLKEKIVHIPNGINEAEYQNKNQDLILKNNHLLNVSYILFVGRFTKIKGPDMLLNAFLKIHKDFPMLNLVFIGPDEGMKNQLEEETKKNLLSHKVHFLGYVSREEKSSIIQGSEFVVIPSRKEAMSIVVLEAGISGKPALMTDQCGFDELEKMKGGLIAEANSESISCGLKKMLSQGDLNKMGSNLKEEVLKKYLWSKVADSHVENYKKVIGVL